MEKQKMYYNISCIDWGITGSPVVVLDTNQDNWDEISNIINQNAVKYPNAKFVINPVII